VSWTDNTNNIRGNQNLYFAKSTDGGNTFIIQPVNLVRQEVLDLPAIPHLKKLIYTLYGQLISLEIT
jgi:hypothetical protein